MRIDQLTFTRFLAALPIVVYHFGKQTFFFTNETVNFLFQKAYLGVSYFFVLSGFVLILAYGNKSQIKPWEFFKARLARIYPAYLLGIVLLWTYMLLNQTMSNHRGILLNIFAIQAFIPGHALDFNYPSWSISVEFFFYLIFPFVFNHVYSKIELKKLLSPILLLWLVTQVVSYIMPNSGFYQGFPSKSHDFIYYFPLMHLNEFLLGNLAGLFFIHKLKDKTGNYDLPLLALLVLLIFAIKHQMTLNLHNGLLALIFIPMIILLSLNKGFISRLFKMRLFTYLGEISYGIYILQVPVYYYISELLAGMNVIDPSLKFILYCLGLILAAAASHRFLETPIRNKVRRSV